MVFALTVLSSVAFTTTNLRGQFTTFQIVTFWFLWAVAIFSVVIPVYMNRQNVRGTLTITSIIKLCLGIIILGASAITSVGGNLVSASFLAIFVATHTIGALESLLDHLTVASRIEKDIENVKMGLFPIITPGIFPKITYGNLGTLTEITKVRTLAVIQFFNPSTGQLYIEEKDAKKASPPMSTQYATL